MIFTLAWKEIREHQGIWLTMVFMSVVLGLGLAKIVALGDANLAAPVAALTILGLAATYGVVCGAMMFAGEHEGGTLVFLDIFLGRRSLLWLGKFVIGIVLAAAQALVVAAILGYLQHDAPRWVTAIVGNSFIRPWPGQAGNDPRVWLFILPVVTLEAFAWGLLGSALTKRVLAGAALAALGFTPILLLALVAPAEVFFVVRIGVMVVCLIFSFAMFLSQSREAIHGAGTLAFESGGQAAEKEQFLQRWEIYERDLEDDKFDAPVTIPVAIPIRAEERAIPEPDPPMPESVDEGPDQPPSPRAALWWLTLQQARPVMILLGAICFLVGFIIPANSQILWPLATLFIGVACGTAAFAPEQRDGSYHFLAAQHLPMTSIWRFKITFWATIALMATMVLLGGAVLAMALSSVGADQAGRNRPHWTFAGLLGPTLFSGVFLAYGFCTAQIVVWYCRKTILALLVTTMIAGLGVGLWLPSMVCGGMGGWQLWVMPLMMLAATWYLMRAWAGGRIFERKPLAGLAGFASAVVVWAALNFGYRAFEITNVGEPIEPKAFRETFPKENLAGNAIQKAIVHVDFPGEDWLPPMAAAARMPVGVLEIPSAEGNLAGLRHLPACRNITDRLLRKAKASEPGPALDYLGYALVMSRNLRNKAPLESYLAGVEHEADALAALDQWLARGKPAPDLLRRVLDELNRHADETPTPLDCVQTECYRSTGILDNPVVWSFAPPDGVGRIPERWLVGGIALSMETPWEMERKERLWRLVWAGLFRGIQTPHWELPESIDELRTEKAATRRIMQCWLPAADSRVSRAQTARRLDASWLADERIFCSITALRGAATRARWRVDATRQAVALALYRLDEGKGAQQLQDLVPKYLASLPVDPYAGQPYHYLIDPQNGRETLWSTGPDRIDHAAAQHGGHLADDDPRWARGNFDLIMAVPHW